jgi:hypothetical protein
VKEQMGHSSIQVTVDTYGHLIPGADIAWVDRLDTPTVNVRSDTRTLKSANYPQAASDDVEDGNVEVVEKNWLPPGIRTPIC